jgi:N-acetylglutamate synthase
MHSMSLCPQQETSEVALVERASLRAWPAEETESLDGWLLRANGGFTRRANSVSPLASLGAIPRGGRIELAERWYRRRNLAPCFQIGSGSAAARLAQDLTRASYRPEGQTLVQAARVPHVLAASCSGGSSDLSVWTSETPDADWQTIAIEASRFALHRTLFLRLLERIGARARYFTATLAGEPVAACLGVVDGGLLGVYDVLCLPAFRRRGATTALMCGVAKYAERERIRRLYLQLDFDNEPARALYARLGFVTLFDYHYLTAPDA